MKHEYVDRLTAEHSALVVVDMQPSVLGAIARTPVILERTKFLVDVCALLRIPVLSTVQNEARLGGTEPDLAVRIGVKPIDKMTFGCCGSGKFRKALLATERPIVLLAGIETHICIAQTALQLLEDEFDVVIAVDAVGARTDLAHRSGLERLRDGGAELLHSEAIVYEWLGTAEHPQFRAVLDVVKRYPPAE
ncbi:MAG TPA: isochorismatase family protein [Fimbriimonadaceae bacterium]|nr:isochorismatase family protein [Fimbriimonadaceae bacterium]